MSEIHVAKRPGPAATDTEPATRSLLSAVELYKTYRLGRVDVPVLKGATLHVKQGEWVAVLGASGSGKSTLLHLFGDLDQPDSTTRKSEHGILISKRERSMRRGVCPECNYPIGVSAVCTECGYSFGEVFFSSGEVFFEGHSLSSMSRRQRDRYRNKSVGFVFQFYHLLAELTVLENTFLPGLVGLHRWRYYRQIGQLRARARSVLDSCGLGHRLKHRPRELSGGERQRVAIARALMNQPKVLLADEPTGNLDETTGEEILDLIAEQHRDGLTIVMVTHDPAIARRADRLVRLHDGRIQDVSDACGQQSVG